MKLPSIQRGRDGVCHIRPEFPPTKVTKGKYALSADIAFWHWPRGGGEWIRLECRLGRELGPQRLSIVDRSVDGRMEPRVESKSKTHTHVVFKVTMLHTQLAPNEGRGREAAWRRVASSRSCVKYPANDDGGTRGASDPNERASDDAHEGGQCRSSHLRLMGRTEISTVFHHLVNRHRDRVNQRYCNEVNAGTR